LDRVDGIKTCGVDGVRGVDEGEDVFTGYLLGLHLARYLVNVEEAVAGCLVLLERLQKG